MEYVPATAYKSSPAMITRQVVMKGNRTKLRISSTPPHKIAPGPPAPRLIWQQDDNCMSAILGLNFQLLWHTLLVCSPIILDVDHIIWLESFK